MLTGGKLGFGGGAVLGALGGFLHGLAASAEAAEAGDFTAALILAVDAGGGSAMAGALLAAPYVMIVGATIGLAAYGSYELYKHLVVGSQSASSTASESKENSGNPGP